MKRKSIQSATGAFTASLLAALWVAPAPSLAATADLATTGPAADWKSYWPSPYQSKAATGPGDTSTIPLRPTLYFDNDGTIAKPIGHTDRHYTAGFGASLQWQGSSVDETIGKLPSFDGEFDLSNSQAAYSAGVLLGMEMYTPQNITSSEPQLQDRPYAGWSYLGLLVQRSKPAQGVFEHIQLDLGIMGHASRAGEVQRRVHEFFGQAEPNGWQHQVHDSFGADFKYTRRYRYGLYGGGDGFGVQLLPEAGAILGTVHTNLNAAATLRAGWNLPDDFGPGALQSPADFTAPAAPVTDSYLRNLRRTVSGYFYLRPAGRIVAHDATIEGSLFRSDPVEQDPELLVGQIRGGFVLGLFRRVELGYSQTFSTREFKGQQGTDAYGSWTLAVTHTW